MNKVIKCPLCNKLTKYEKIMHMAGGIITKPQDFYKCIKCGYMIILKPKGKEEQIMTLEKLQTIVGKAKCKAYKAYLDYKLCEDITMSSEEITIMHYTIEELAKDERLGVIEEINNFDIEEVGK